MKVYLLLTLLLTITGQSWAKRMSFPYAGRTFTLVTPHNIPKKASLLVLIHGCSQTAKMILDGTELDKAAEKNGFIILAPDQLPLYNPGQCWNWFLDHEQRRSLTNEMGQIIAAINFIFGRYDIDKEKVFVAGMSSGAATALNLSVCYPDYFTGSAIHSGLAYKSAENIFEAQSVFSSTKQKSPELLGQKMLSCSPHVKNHRLKKMIVIQGEEDDFVLPLHAELIHQANASWRDYLDDGSLNSSERGKITSRSTSQIQQRDTHYTNFHERLIMVEGMGHAWGGGLPHSQYFDPKAPSSNEAILSFFGILK